MNIPHELGALKQQWQAQPAALPQVAALRERVAAETRASWRTLLFVTLGTMAVLGATLTYALRSDDALAWQGFWFTAIFATLVWVVALLLSRGTWRPQDESIAAHLNVSIQRCRSVIIAAPIGIVLYMAGLIGSLAWKQRMLGADWQVLAEAPAMILAGWIGAPLYAFGMLWNAQRHRRRLRTLLELKRQLREG